MNYEFADIEIYIQGQGKVLSEKSLIAYETDTNKILAIGNQAQQYIYSTADNISVISPLRQGMVADFNVSVVLFANLMEKAWGKKPLFKPSVAVCVPVVMTEVESKAMEDVLIQAGAKHVYLSNMPIREFLKASDAGEFSKYKMILNITKVDAQGYLIEELERLLSYAQQTGISVERVKELLSTISEKS